jgi:hypothetical protein
LEAPVYAVFPLFPLFPLLFLVLAMATQNRPEMCPQIAGPGGFAGGLLTG